MNRNILKVLLITVSLALTSVNALANKEGKVVNKFSDDRPAPLEIVAISWEEVAQIRNHLIKYGKSGDIICISVYKKGRDRFCTEKY